MIAAIREDAQAEVERIDQETAKEVAAIRAEEQSVSTAVPDREQRLAAARRGNQERIAQQQWEGRRAEIEQREAWIARVVATARERWSCTPAQLTALVREALQTIEADAYDVAVAARDRDTIDPAKFKEKIRVRTTDIGGGCIVTAGNTVFDNSFDARAHRFEDAWRKALSEVYRP